MMEKLIFDNWEILCLFWMAFFLSLGLYKHRNIIHKSLKDTKDFNDIIRDYEAHKISRELHVPTPGRCVVGIAMEDKMSGELVKIQTNMMIPPRKPKLHPDKKPEFKKCPGCGARKTVLKNGNYECDYCGSDAVLKSESKKVNMVTDKQEADRMFAILSTKKVVLTATNENDRVRF